MVLGPSKGYVQNNFWSNKIMTDVGIFEEIKLHDKIKKLKQLIKEKNDYIKIQDKEIDTLKGQIDLKELEIQMLKKKNEL
tara:strand:+ start:305 stop:544 length:240 start_codon:yes stop_codon:yes gene_type:complete